MAIRNIDYQKCTDCGICHDTCPMDVFRKVGGKVFIAYPEDCMACYLCDMDCPEAAITVTPDRSRVVLQTW